MKNKKILPFIFIVLLLAAFACTNKKEKADVICQNVLITVKDSAQTHFLKAEDVHWMLVKNGITLKGKPISQINADSIEQILLKNTAMKRVECYRTSSGDNIRIDVWQREPLFRVMGKKDYYVDIEGKVIPVSDNYVAYVPIVSGEVAQSFATGELKEFMQFLQNSEFWNAQITQIEVDKGSEITLIPRVGTQEIEFGTLERYQQKLDKLQAFYQEGLSKIGWEEYQKINVKYKDLVFGTK
jgi:cell division protein FtsQ